MDTRQLEPGWNIYINHVCRYTRKRNAPEEMLAILHCEEDETELNLVSRAL